MSTGRDEERGRTPPQEPAGAREPGPPTTLAELLADLEARRLVRPGTSASARERLDASSGTPWFLSALAGTGAWIATVFFVAAVGSLIGLAKLHGDAWPWAVAGALFTGGGLALSRKATGTFASQAALGLSLSGWAQLLFAVVTVSDDFGPPLLAAVVLCIVFHVLFGEPALRFLLAFFTVLTAFAWVVFDHRGSEALPWLLHGLLLTLAVGSLLALAGPWRERLGATGAGVLAGLSAGLLVLVLEPPRQGIDWAPTTLGLTIVLAALLATVFRRRDAAQREALVVSVSAAVVLGLACLPADPGLVLAVIVIVLGHAIARRAVVGFGVVLLAAFLVTWGVALDLSLVARALVLAGSGGAILAARAALARRPWARESREHAGARGDAGGERAGASSEGSGRRALTAVTVLVVSLLALTVARREHLLRSGRTVLLPLATRPEGRLAPGDTVELRYVLPQPLVGAARTQGERSGRLVLRVDRRGVASVERLRREARDGDELRDDEQLLEYRVNGTDLALGAPSWTVPEGADDVHGSDAVYGELKASPEGETIFVGLRDRGLRPLTRQPAEEEVDPK